MSFIVLDRGLLLSLGLFVGAAVVLLRYAEVHARRIAAERARHLKVSRQRI